MATIQVRKNSNGSVSYRGLVRVKGQPPRSATFPSRAEAKYWAKQKETEMRLAKYNCTVAHTKTLVQAIEKYKEEILPRTPKSISERTYQLEWWKEELGQIKLSDQTPYLLSRCVQKLQNRTTQYGKTLSSASVVRYIAALSHVMTVAVKEWGWMFENPIQKVKKSIVRNSRVRFLTTQERQRLILACEQSGSIFLKPIVVLAICTGMRRGEILNLRWKDVDFESKIITLHETKNGERRGVALTDPAFSLIKVLYIDQPNRYVFASPKRPSKAIDIRSAFQIAVKRAEIDDFKFHDLRHCTASYLAMNGATPNEIAEVLGHKSLQMVKRYAHLSHSHVASVVEKTNKAIFQLSGHQISI